MITGLSRRAAEITAAFAYRAGLEPVIRESADIDAGQWRPGWRVALSGGSGLAAAFCAGLSGDTIDGCTPAESAAHRDGLSARERICGNLSAAA